MTRRKLYNSDIIKNYSQCSYLLWKILNHGAFFMPYHVLVTYYLFFFYKKGYMHTPPLLLSTFAKA
jgi:hypothetical protein